MMPPSWMPKLVAGKIQMQLRRVTHGRDVPWAVPGCFDPELFREDGYLSSRRQTSGLRQVDADIIDKALGNQRLPLVRAIE